jgi:hypothetical protein
MTTASYQATKALGYQQITATTTAFALSPPLGTVLILVQAEAQGLRWRDDGVSPTATVGYNIAVGGELRYDAGNMPALRLIASTAGAIANIVYYGGLGN